MRKLLSDPPDAVYLAGFVREVPLVIKQARALGLKSQFFADVVSIDREWLSPGDPEINGLVVSTLAAETQDDRPESRAFASKYEALHGAPPDWAAISGYDTIRILGQVLADGAETGEQIAQKLRATAVFDCLGGGLSFDESGLARREIPLFQVSSARSEWTRLRLERPDKTEARGRPSVIPESDHSKPRD